MTQNVYAKIAAVQGELAKVGISKSRKNMTPGQNYNFRGIDEVYNTLSPLMAQHGLCILPRIMSRTVSERQTRNGGTLFVVVVEAEFDFVSSDDGSVHVVRCYGEAMDSSDKATNKAMSAAYKYAALMTFAIPTEGDNDADATTHEVAPREPEQRRAPAPAVTDQQLDQMKALIPSQTKLTTQIIVEGWGVSDLTELTAEQAEKTIARLKAECRKAKPQLDQELNDEVPV